MNRSPIASRWCRRNGSPRTACGRVWLRPQADDSNGNGDGTRIAVRSTRGVCPVAAGLIDAVARGMSRPRPWC